jgi:Tfp pilus assembly protein FimV
MGKMVAKKAKKKKESVDTGFDAEVEEKGKAKKKNGLEFLIELGIEKAELHPNLENVSNRERLQILAVCLHLLFEEIPQDVLESTFAEELDESGKWTEEERKAFDLLKCVGNVGGFKTYPRCK